MAITSAEELLDLLEKSDLLGPKRLEEVRAMIQEGDNAKMLAGSLVKSGWLSRRQAAQLLAGRTLPKRGGAKPAAASPKRAGIKQAAPLPRREKIKPGAIPPPAGKPGRSGRAAAEDLPDAGKATPGSGQERRAGKRGFLATPQQKIIAGVLAVGLLVVLALLIPFLAGSRKSPEDEVAKTGSTGKPSDFNDPEGEVLDLDAPAPSPPPADPAETVSQGNETGDSELPALPVTRDLALWLAADAGVVRHDDDRVESWGDLLTGDNQEAEDARQESPERRPAWVDAAVGDKPAIRFDGKTNLVTSSFDSAKDQTVVAVFSPAARGDGSYGAQLFNGKTESRIVLAIGSDWTLGAWLMTTEKSGDTKSLSLQKDHPVVATYVYDNTKNRAELRINGTPQKTTTASHSAEGTSEKWIGSHYEGNGFFQGDIAELLVYNSALSEDECRKVESYLGERYELEMADTPTGEAVAKTPEETPKETPQGTPEGSSGQGGKLVFDFETGDLQGWAVVEGEFQSIVSDKDKGPGNKDVKKQGKYYLDTHAGGGNAQKGVVESPVFVLEKPEIKCLLAGGNHNNTVFRIETLDGKQVRTIKANSHALKEMAVSNLNGVVGQKLVLKLVDKTHHRDKGFMLLDNVRIPGRIDVEATKERWRKLKLPDDVIAAVGAGTAAKTTEDPATKPDPAKTPAEPTAGSTGGNLVFLNLDDKSGQLRDASGNNHHGKVQGAVAYGEEGKHDNAVRFDGNGHVVIQGSDQFNHNADFTWTAWVKTTENDTKIIAFAPIGNRGKKGQKFLSLQGGKLRFTSHQVGQFSGKATVNDDQWHHVAVVAQSNIQGDKDKVTLYVDGKPDGDKGNWSYDKEPQDGFVMKLGIVTDTRSRFKGALDGVTVWSRALKPNEIAATKAPLVSAFKTLRTTGALKPLDKPSTNKVQPIGKLVLKPGQTVDLELVGGRTAVRPPRQIEMDKGKNQWPIYLVAKGRGDAPKRAPIARVLLKEDTLYFQWAQGLSPKHVNGLLNCGLNVSVDDKSRFLPLGRPQVIEPATVNLKTGTSKVVLPAERLPAPELLQMEIVRLEGGFPPTKYSAGRTLAPNGQTGIAFDADNIPNFGIGVKFNAGAHPAIEVGAMIQYTLLNPQPTLFRFKEAEQYMRQLAGQQQQLYVQLRAAGNDKRKQGEVNKKLKPIQQEIGKFESLGQLLSKLKDKPGKIHFRIFTMVDGEHEVTLLQSFAPAGGEEQAAAPNGL